MDLPTFLALPHRFRWGGVGGDDCTTFCATWVSETLGIDPAADLRGTYRTADGAAAIVSAAGGLVAFVDGRLAPLGFCRVSDHKPGDLGVVIAPVGLGEDIKQVSAISLGKTWAVLGPHGVCGKKLDHIAVWRRED